MTCRESRMRRTSKDRSKSRAMRAGRSGLQVKQGRRKS